MQHVERQNRKPTPKVPKGSVHRCFSMSKLTLTWLWLCKWCMAVFCPHRPSWLGALCSRRSWGKGNCQVFVLHDFILVCFSLCFVCVLLLPIGLIWYWVNVICLCRSAVGHRSDFYPSIRNQYPSGSSHRPRFSLHGTWPVPSAVLIEVVNPSNPNNGATWCNLAQLWGWNCLSSLVVQVWLDDFGMWQLSWRNVTLSDPVSHVPKLQFRKLTKSLY